MSVLAVLADMRAALGDDQAHDLVAAAWAGFAGAAEDVQCLRISSAVSSHAGKIGGPVAQAGATGADAACEHGDNGAV